MDFEYGSPEHIAFAEAKLGDGIHSSFQPMETIRKKYRQERHTAWAVKAMKEELER